MYERTYNQKKGKLKVKNRDKLKGRIVVAIAGLQADGEKVTPVSVFNKVKRKGGSRAEPGGYPCYETVRKAFQRLAYKGSPYLKANGIKVKKAILLRDVYKIPFQPQPDSPAETLTASTVYDSRILEAIQDIDEKMAMLQRARSVLIGREEL